MLSRLIGTFVVLAGISYGQLPTSSVTGSVVDPQGLPVAGAKVTVLNEGTKVAYEATTTSAGEYAVTGLAPGSYSVTVNQPGFSVVRGASQRPQYRRAAGGERQTADRLDRR